MPLQITSISPSAAVAGAAQFSLVVNGTDFAADAEVRWGTTVLAVTAVSTTQLTATVPSSLLAAGAFVKVSVKNVLLNTISNEVTFTVRRKLHAGLRAQKTTLRPVQGKTFAKTFYLQGADGVPYDLTDVTMRLQARERAADYEAGQAALLDLTMANGGLTTNVPTGAFTINLTATQTQALNWTRARFELEVTTPDNIVLSLLAGEMRVEKEWVR